MIIKHQLLLNSFLFIAMLLGRSLIDASSALPFVRVQELYALVTLVLWVISFGNLGLTLITQKRDQLLWFAFLSIYSLGFGIHLVANYLSETLLPPSSAVYFYDEILGHALIWIGYLGGLAVLCYESLAQKVVKEKLSLIHLLTSIAHGGVMALAVIEGQSVIIAGSFSLLIALYIFRSKDFVNKYYLIMLLSNLAILALYGMYFEGFPELSTIRQSIF